jgi:hypothetical protein
MPIRASSLFQGLRGGGDIERESRNVLDDNFGDALLCRGSEYFKMLPHLGAGRRGRHGFFERSSI